MLFETLLTGENITFILAAAFVLTLIINAIEITYKTEKIGD